MKWCGNSSMRVGKISTGSSSSSSSSSASPCPPPPGPMMKAITVMMQPGWGTCPNHGWCTVEFGGLSVRSPGLKTPSSNRSMSLGRETVATLEP
jgi:hypothetical protein